jgi:hypothetical protein
VTHLIDPVLIAIAAGLMFLLMLAVALAVRHLAGLPYKKKETLLSPAERSFYGVLRRAADHDVDVFAKVRLIDLLWIPPGARDRQTHLKRVMAKHVDFVLCDRDTSAPRLVIELDDSSHAQQRERDAFVDRVLKSAGLPLLRVPARRGYNARELAETLRTLLPD